MLSDAGVLITTLCLFVGMGLLPLFQTLAETVYQEEIENLDENIRGRDYSILLSSLFGAAGLPVPDDAYTYIRDVDEYRIRVARGIEENNEFVQALKALVQHYPKRLADGYQEEIEVIEQSVWRHKAAILPYIESDAFLSDAVVAEYDLRTVNVFDSIISAIEGVFGHRDTSVERLREIREEAYALRRDITVLYSRARMVMRDQ